ncbi:MAG: M23 family metallopeptidase [Defluviitaleaceae bacterium]|nr:M23 family metallopeptidase [Defluviitaleaceae bacterium]MCL2275032.1 M23 family metallopeptidase [Defluviitaleaceae bacterium]
MFFKKDPLQAQAPKVKKASDIISASGSHKQKKYWSIILAPSYTSGKTRTLRVPRAAFYCVLISLFVVSAVIAGLQIRANYAMRMAQNYNILWTEMEEKFDNAMLENEEELDAWLAAHADVTDALEREQLRARFHENHLMREHYDSLHDLQDEILDLRNLIYELDESLTAAIAGLSRRAFIPSVANHLERLNTSQAEIRAAFYENQENQQYENGEYTNGYYANGYYSNGETVPVAAIASTLNLNEGAVFLGGGSLALPPALTEEALLKQIEESLQMLAMLVELKEDFQERRARIQPYLTNHPTLWPVRGNISSGFGSRRDPFSGNWAMHSGVDIPAPHGTPIRATGGGTVVFAGWAAGGFGNKIIICHGLGIQTLYAHNQRHLVNVGQRVERGDIIAHVGSTGNTTGPHVHYEVHVNGRPVNPRTFLLE